MNTGWRLTRWGWSGSAAAERVVGEGEGDRVLNRDIRESDKETPQYKIGRLALPIPQKGNYPGFSQDHFRVIEAPIDLKGPKSCGSKVSSYLEGA